MFTRFVTDRRDHPLSKVIKHQQRRFYFQPPDHRRILAAQTKLGLSNAPTNLDQLRHAYVKAVKQCHPDLHHHNPDKMKFTIKFHQVQESYELLLMSFRASSSNSHRTDLRDRDADADDWDVSEEHYRWACQEWLGIAAEKVEDSLRCPMFQQWLGGRSDAAAHWRSFLIAFPYRLEYFQQSRRGLHSRATSGSSCVTEQPLRRKKI